MSRRVLLHIPHASLEIPIQWRGLFALPEDDLQRELLLMTDRYTDELFVLEGADRLEFPVSRLLVDPERFEQDEDEPMATRGMGAVYRLTHDGRPLKSPPEREHLLNAYYRPHHRALSTWTRRALAEHGRCLIIDCHSFPSMPLPCDLDQAPHRPDVCVGTSSIHTPAQMKDATVEEFQRLGYSVEVDRPYAGSIVPMEYWQVEPRVESLMIEVNRALYMCETTGEKLGRYAVVLDDVGKVLRRLVGR